MKKIAFILLAAGSVAMTSCGQKSKSSAKLKTDVDSLSYAIGISVGSSFAQNDIKEINVDELSAAISDIMSKDSLRPMMDQRVAQTVIQTYLMKQFDIKHAKDIEAGEDFMKQNASKPGIDTMHVTYMDEMPGGKGTLKTAVMQYQVIKQGNGPKPIATDVVKVNYIGTLIDGTKFDSSYDRKEPAQFRLNGVIKGWTAGLERMNVGSTYKFYIPAELAYGRFGRNPIIPPYATLVFEVELLSIDNPAAPAPAAPTGKPMKMKK
ncbi:MAG TPA: FKBP-type peptidyl-prolyl cis-trans isomerase [Williamwhitmania sp.]|nr:FKBP-type peptidyl-prolyl cis-trans isomerase [Williamwhitmania sp.]